MAGFGFCPLVRSAPKLGTVANLNNRIKKISEKGTRIFLRLDAQVYAFPSGEAVAQHVQSSPREEITGLLSH